mmetsp:Transcript_24825/g.42029  ORF Transcript_24825/g.42029 Transcript_24825/m.42029 type:complete len:468 (-) Transcript_24825:265-1668(-)
MKLNTEPDDEAKCEDRGDDFHTPSLPLEKLDPPSPTSQISHPITYEEKKQLLRSTSIGQSPNACKRLSSFGATLKLKPSKKGESAIAIEKGSYYTSAEKVGKWKKNNHLGQTLPRDNIVDTFGKLMVQPGPSDYRPLTEKRSTQRTDPHWSIYDRDKYKGSVDAVKTPGPGTYMPEPGIKPAEPYIVRQEKTKLIKSIDKIGPGSYDIRRTAEMATQRFHREVSAHLPKRDYGSKTREILDFNTLKIKKNKQKRIKKAEKKNKIDDDRSHLGPGAYFPIANEPSPSVCYNADQTLPIHRKYDHDPDVPTRVVHTFGVRRENFALGKDQNTPGPGEYDFMESLYGSQPLLEAGGAASRPGKGTAETTDSAGIVKGQHASLNLATKSAKYLPKMKSVVNMGGKTSTGVWANFQDKKKERANAYKSPYATKRKVEVKIQRNVGRLTESTAQDLPFRFSGRQSTGAFFQFH